MATYGITAVRYNAAKTHIEKVKVHQIIGDGISSTSQEVKRQDVITAIKNGDSYWTYIQRGGQWVKGAKVKRITVNGSEYLRTDDNERASDNLENLPTF